MRQRRVRTPNRATAINKPIQRPDTYQRLPENVQLNTCEQQPVHTCGLSSVVLCAQKEWLLSRKAGLAQGLSKHLDVDPPHPKAPLPRHLTDQAPFFQPDQIALHSSPARTGQGLGHWSRGQRPFREDFA